MEIIDFNYFFMATKDKLDICDIRTLNPYAQVVYFKDKDMYYGISFIEDRVDINIAVGRGLRDSLLNIGRQTLEWKKKKIRFYTREDHPLIHKIAALIDAKKVNVISNFYDNGKNGYVYEIDEAEIERYIAKTSIKE